MSKKPAEPDEMRMSADRFDKVMRKSIGVVALPADVKEKANLAISSQVGRTLSDEEDIPRQGMKAENRCFFISVVDTDRKLFDLREPVGDDLPVSQKVNMANGQTGTH